MLLLRAGTGKKYQVLNDDPGPANATVNAGNDEWRETFTVGQGKTIWMKFSAPQRQSSRCR